VSDPDQDDREGGGRTLQLTEAERELLIKACQRYKAGIPAYLKSREDERATLDALLAKLG
jgi:hypothetical protein